MRKAEPFVRQLRQMRCHVLFAMGPHCRLLHANVIPTKVIDHVDDDIGLFGGVGSCGEYQNQKCNRCFHGKLLPVDE